MLNKDVVDQQGLNRGEGLPLTPEQHDAFMEEVTRRANAKVALEKNKHAGGYVPRGNCEAIFKNHDPECVLGGPAGTGKSRAILEKLHRLCNRHDGMRALIVRKTRTSLTTTGLVTYEDEVLGPDSPIRDGPRRQNRSEYYYPNGSVVVVGGMDRSTRVLSAQYDFIYVQEATELSEAEWEILTTRNRNFVTPHQEMMGDCNPDHPEHWIKQRSKRGNLTLLDTNHEDNPVLWFIDEASGWSGWTYKGSEYIAKLDALTGSRKERLRFGRWVSAEGAIYPGFDADIHVVDAYTIPDEWERFLAIDFGFVAPFVCQWWAINPLTKQMIMYREIYQSRTLVEDLAEVIESFTDTAWVARAICDHDAEDRETLAKHLPRITFENATKNVSAGINACAQRLKVKDGFPGVVFFRDAQVTTDPFMADKHRPVNTVQEIPGYAWMKNKPGQKSEGPIKTDDHGVDAWRYATMYMDGKEARFWIA